MALKALDILKFLPKKAGCKECGQPTCLAFAMKVAQKQAAIDECPHVTDEAKSALEGASAPPIRLVTIGAGENKLEIGNETVMFRHEETFYHPPGIAVRVTDDLDGDALAARVATIGALKFFRVGSEIRVDTVAVDNVSGDAGRFKSAVEAASKLDFPMVLIAKGVDQMAAALEVCADKKPLIHAARPDNWEGFAALAKDKGCPLAVQADNLEALAELTAKVKAAGVEDMVLDVTADGLNHTLQNLTMVRRLSLKKGVRDLGYPCITFARGDDPFEEVAQAASYIAKYAGIVVTSLSEPEQILPILTVRTNVYTDPRKPIQVEPTLHEVGATTPQSPVLITTNFSLTYYSVEGEVEASRVPAYIGVIDTEGTSVLTAFASDKFTAEGVAAFLKSDALKDKVAHKKVIIPGYVAAMSGAVEDESGWEVIVGPREASGIPKFLKTVWS
ncbi:MAG: acetyl-CoA decarbonylase/synthase complex subunit gamma [Dehalococcoidia bacterium]|nr:acetyl-CoA decarbonylase/synthase complex subunit gamma [Dehalococcoidia bacterium]